MTGEPLICLLDVSNNPMWYLGGLVESMRLPGLYPSSCEVLASCAFGHFTSHVDENLAVLQLVQDTLQLRLRGFLRVLPVFREATVTTA